MDGTGASGGELRPAGATPSHRVIGLSAPCRHEALDCAVLGGDDHQVPAVAVVQPLRHPRRLTGATRADLKVGSYVRPAATPDCHSSKKRRISPRNCSTDNAVFRPDRSSEPPSTPFV